MSLIVNALLLDPQGQPLANLDAQVFMFALAGTAKMVGAGRAGTDGRLAISCNFTPVATADYQPRIQLRLKRGSAFVEASENPQSANANLCDFGSVSFDPNPPVVMAAPMMRSVADSTARVVASSMAATASTAATATASTTPVVDAVALQNQISVLTQTKTNLELQLNQVTLQKNTALSDLQARDTLLAQKDALITQKTTDLTNLQATRQAELQARDTLVAQKDALISQKTTDFNNLQATRQAELQARDTLLAQKDALISQKTADLSKLQSTHLAELQSRDSLLAQKDAQLSQKATELGNLQTAHQADLKAKDSLLAQKDAALADVQGRLDAVQKGEVPQIALNLLAQNSADQLKTTQARLLQDKSGFQLGKVSLQLKVMTGSNGGQVGLPRTSDIERVGASALGQVQLDFHPPGQSAVATNAQQTSVPALAGYTELLARRKLAESRLACEVLYQLVLLDEQAGRVVRQSPAAGTQVAPDSSVMIAIGKKG